MIFLERSSRQISFEVGELGVGGPGSSTQSLEIDSSESAPEIIQNLGINEPNVGPFDGVVDDEPWGGEDPGGHG